MNDMQSIDETRNIAAAQGEHARFAGRVWKGALAWSLICLMAFAWRPGAAAQQSQKPSDWKIFIANDACSDYTWGDDEKQNRRDFADVVRAHLDEILQTKGQASQIDHYNLSITQEALAFAEYYPDRKEELIRRIKEGYIAVGPDYNNSLWGFQSTEGMIRTLYPARRLEKEWGLPLNDVAQHIEEPALPWGVAAILAGSGYHWLVAPFLDYDSTFSKLANPPLFVWEGADGSRIRVIMDRFASEKRATCRGLTCCAIRSALTPNGCRITRNWMATRSISSSPQGPMETTIPTRRTWRPTMRRALRVITRSPASTRSW
jgi:hypothetical protein